MGSDNAPWLYFVLSWVAIVSAQRYAARGDRERKLAVSLAFLISSICMFIVVVAHAGG